MTAVPGRNIFLSLTEKQTFVGGELRWSYSTSIIRVKFVENHSRITCIRSILRVLRAMVDGPYVGWRPTIEDWDRIKVCSVIYVDEDGFLSRTETKPKFRGNSGHSQDASPRIPELHRTTYPFGGPTESADPGALRKTTGSAGYGAIQPGDLPPAGFFVKNPHFRDGSGMPSPSELSSPSETSETIGLTEDSSSALPMGLMIYNDLMMDIGGTARFLGQEFHDSVLFGPTPTPSDRYSDRGPELQPPNAPYE